MYIKLGKIRMCSRHSGISHTAVKKFYLPPSALTGTNLKVLKAFAFLRYALYEVQSVRMKQYELLNEPSLHLILGNFSNVVDTRQFWLNSD